VLPRQHRIVSADDFRHTIRRGVKSVAPHLIVYRHGAPVARVGIVISKKCGGAVVRNTLRRQTRAITRRLIDVGRLSGDVVIRFRCEGTTVSFAELEAEIGTALGAFA
jgi:ribonuclease P protein component